MIITQLESIKLASTYFSDTKNQKFNSHIFNDLYIDTLKSIYPYHFQLILHFKIDNDSALLISTLNDNVISFYNEKAHLFIFNNSKNVLIDGILHYLNLKAYKYKITLDELFVDPKLNIKYHLNAQLSLLKSETEILQNCRKSYRSLINWGKKNLIEKIIDHTNPDMFYDFVNFYHLVSQNKKPDLFWEKYLDLLKNKNAFILVSYINQESQLKIVSSVLIITFNKQSNYALGAYDKNLMIEQNLPLAHWPLLSSILHCKRNGDTIFNLGSIDELNENTKEKNIYYFKRGFSDQEIRIPFLCND